MPGPTAAAASGNFTHLFESALGIPRGMTTAPNASACFEHDGNSLRLPRGPEDEASGPLRDAGHDVSVTRDHTGSDPLGVRPTGDLGPEQLGAMTEVLTHPTGVLIAPPGAGKTGMACPVIAARDLPTAAQAVPQYSREGPGPTRCWEKNAPGPDRHHHDAVDLAS